MIKLTTGLINTGAQKTPAKIIVFIELNSEPIKKLIVMMICKGISTKFIMTGMKFLLLKSNQNQ